MAYQRNTIVEDVVAGSQLNGAPARAGLLGGVETVAPPDIPGSDSLKHLARELHDGIAQELWYLHSELECLANKLTEEQAPLKADVVRLRNVASEAYREIRSTLERLYSRSHSQVDLAEELKGIAEKFASSIQMDVEFRSSLPARAAMVASEVGKQACRLIQEALWNSWRHGMSDRIEVSVSAPEKDGGLVVTASDNGCGFLMEEEFQNGHYGLRNMRERAEAIHGRLEVSSRIGIGTTVTLHLPL